MRERDRYPKLHRFYNTDLHNMESVTYFAIKDTQRKYDNLQEAIKSEDKDKIKSALKELTILLEALLEYRPYREDFQDMSNEMYRFACESGFLDIASELLNAKVDTTNLLCKVAGEGKTETVQAMIKSKININTIRSDGASPLLLAAGYGRADTTSALIDAKADIEIKYKNDSTLFYAIDYDMKEIVKKLVNLKVNLDARSSRYETPLFFAVLGKHKEIALTLIEGKADPNMKSFTIFGDNPLSKTIETGQWDITQKLIEAKANIYVEDLLLAQKTLPNQVSTLLDMVIKNKIQIMTKSGNSDLHGAIELGHWDLADRLIEAKSEINVKDLLLVHKRFPDHLQTILDRANKDKIIHDIGPERKTELDQNRGFLSDTLFWAISKNHFDLASTLIVAKADPNHVDKKDEPPLKMVIEKGDKDLAHKLIEAKANISLDHFFLLAQKPQLLSAIPDILLNKFLFAEQELKEGKKTGFQAILENLDEKSLSEFLSRVNRSYELRSIVFKLSLDKPAISAKLLELMNAETFIFMMTRDMQPVKQFAEKIANNLIHETSWQSKHILETLLFKNPTKGQHKEFNKMTAEIAAAIYNQWKGSKEEKMRERVPRDVLSLIVPHLPWSKGRKLEKFLNETENMAKKARTSERKHPFFKENKTPSLNIPLQSPVTEEEGKSVEETRLLADSGSLSSDQAKAKHPSKKTQPLAKDQITDETQLIHKTRSRRSSSS
ncbi:MAG: ankyrin repeat domain-containing protein [Gammaproteobacteria bacterium]